ncbi:Aste57867_14738 [Aphanomyces stellatus]|uniref:Aste57867_14738 protein n=1 Tax=Aphanomyces stellatus TaxID=120398 RepID=A0A485L434_9STRA|nr:hypothetical protein As57867_014683 [Aphanomyces stellatus]VFT91556.1 Aste57867_14738 [Aphanomyces stellatus]
MLLRNTIAIAAVVASSLPEETCPAGKPCILTTTLHNGVVMPLVGMGLAGMHGDLTTRSVHLHVDAGFRFFDGAQAKEWYDEVAAGGALFDLMQKGIVDRSDVFLSSKVHPASLDDAGAAVREMLSSWHTPVLDLVLLHYPRCFDGIRDCKDKPAGDWRSAWRVLEALVDEGTIRAIGVSNFDLHELDALWAHARIPPHVVQMWIDPFHQARADVAFCKSRGAAVFSYSSLGTQWEGIVGRNLVWESHVLRFIAAKHNASVPAVVLSFFLRQAIGVVPRSTSPSHVADNAKLLDGRHVVPLDMDDVAAIETMDGVYDIKPACSREDCVTLDDRSQCLATCLDV